MWAYFLFHHLAVTPSSNRLTATNTVSILAAIPFVGSMAMKLGVIFPQTEIGSDPGALREFAQAAEDMGYNQILAYEHVLGADTTNRPDWKGMYTIDSAFHEPFVLFGYLAGVTKDITLATGIVILPQRQTALVAKQAAEVDVLSNGRLRLGVGLGWNQLEYEAMGKDFHNRGKRLEEQVQLLRALWTKESVTFEGDWESVIGVGINPMPVQRPIPIWMGGNADAVIRRVATISDGWIAPIKPDADGRKRVEEMYVLAGEAGRDPFAIGIEGRTDIRNSTEDDWATAVAAWYDLGATHLDVSTMGAGLETPEQHIAAIRKFKSVADALK